MISYELTCLCPPLMDMEQGHTEHGDEGLG
jgi:hypothetical protein